eukprot:2630889-Pyramimonas_sp.AAC.1
MARMFATIVRPKIVGKFSPGLSAALAEWASTLAMACCPAGLPLYAQAILQCPDDLHTAAPSPTQVTHGGLLRFNICPS